MRQIASLFLLLSLVSLQSACIYQRNLKSTYIDQKKYQSVFIDIPKNNVVFDNIAPTIQQVLSDHFQQVGYQLSSSRKGSFTLLTTVTALKPSQKYISPDVLLFHYEIALKLECQLLDLHGNHIAKKTFNFSGLISNPRNPILTSSFLAFEYEKLMKFSAPSIEQFFRPHLQKYKS